MNQEALKKLRRLFVKLEDTPACPRGCHKCCGPVAVCKTEAELMGLPEGRLYTLSKGEYDDTCEFVNDETGQCDVYENRPFICRLFNACREGVFCCMEIPEFGNYNTVDTISMFDEYAQVIRVEGSSLKEIEYAMDAVYTKMKQRECRNGWHMPKAV